MKVTALWVYPIKGLRGVPLESARLTAQGIIHDRSFMLCRVSEDGALEKLQVVTYPQCALFRQDIIGDSIHVRYLTPDEPLVPHRAEHDIVLEVPLRPNLDNLDRADVNVHQSLVNAYRMDEKYNDWFSACFGFKTVLLYIGDQRRPVLGTFSPKAVQQQQQQSQKGWLSSITSYVTGSSDTPEADWLTFSDCAPYLITTEASLANVRQRLASGDVDMVKFRPNIVLDGDDSWAEDFWAELSLSNSDGGDLVEPAFVLSKMCGRCASVNVDYATGKPAVGEQGTVLKKLMSDRRVDKGHKWSPVFGRYGFLGEVFAQNGGGSIALGDQIGVVRTNKERPEWDWHLKDPSIARYYSPQRV